MTFELICFDFAGTTMVDEGLVLEAFRRTIEEFNIVGDHATWATAYVIETMGQSKIEVFAALFDDRATDANESFERHFINVASDVGVREIPGARACVETLKGRGVGVALTTGFSPATREALIELLDWSDLFTLRVSPSDAGRGRPAPDMVLSCALRAYVSAVQTIAVVGDTASDMQSGRRAGVGYCVGVLSGTDDETRLLESGADAVLDSVAGLTGLDIFSVD